MGEFPPLSTPCATRPRGPAPPAQRHHQPASRSPVADHDLGLGQAGELLDVEQLVAYPGVEALDVRVLHGEPGSMHALPAREKRHRSCRAWAVSSGPLSILRYSGAPRSRVNSSTTFSSRSTRPSAVWCWKSSAHTRFGRSGPAAAGRAWSSHRAAGAPGGGPAPAALPRATAAASACGSPPSPPPATGDARGGNPHRGRSAEISRSRARSAASSSARVIS